MKFMRLYLILIVQLQHAAYPIEGQATNEKMERVELVTDDIMTR